MLRHPFAEAPQAAHPSPLLKSFDAEAPRSACPLCGVIEPLPSACLSSSSDGECSPRSPAQLEAEMRTLKLENSLLRRTSTLPTSALSSAARIMHLEEQLRESEVQHQLTRCDRLIFLADPQADRESLRSSCTPRPATR
jgi:hypothetical protein